MLFRSPWVHRRAYAPVVGAESGFTLAQGDARGGEHANDPHSHATPRQGERAREARDAGFYLWAQTPIDDVEFALSK